MGIQWELKHWNTLTKEELYELIALRIRVFIIEQNCPYQDADGKDLHSFHLFAMNEKDECIACLRVLEPEISYPEWSIGRVATDMRIRQTGIGKEIMEHPMQWLKEYHGN